MYNLEAGNVRELLFEKYVWFYYLLDLLEVKIAKNYVVLKN